MEVLRGAVSRRGRAAERRRADRPKRRGRPPATGTPKAAPPSAPIGLRHGNVTRGRLSGRPRAALRARPVRARPVRARRPSLPVPFAPGASPSPASHRSATLPCMSVYCRIAPGHPFHGPYHDREYGFPVKDEAALFERLALEMNQAGLSWLTILKKRESFRQAFRGFDPSRVARFGARDRARLLADAGIVRNRAKV